MRSGDDNFKCKAVSLRDISIFQRNGLVEIIVIIQNLNCLTQFLSELIKGFSKSEVKLLSTAETHHSSKRVEWLH